MPDDPGRRRDELKRDIKKLWTMRMFEMMIVVSFMDIKIL